MRCGHGDAGLPDEALFCHACGRRVTSTEALPQGVKAARWILIGTGALALVGAGALPFLLVLGELPPELANSPLLIAILAINVVLGAAQIGSGMALRQRERLTHRVATVASALALLLALVDIAITVFGDAGGSPAIAGVRVGLNAVAIRQLIETRDWLAQVTIEGSGAEPRST